MISFTTIPATIKTEQTFTIGGKAEGFDDNEELVLLADGRFELARPRVKDSKWQAPVLFHQAGKRRIEIISSEQERAEIELDVQPDNNLNVLSRSVWTSDPTPSSIPDLAQAKRITIHHTFIKPTLSASADKSDEVQRMRDIRRGHMNRTPPFSDIGYHFVIMPSGRIYSARSERKRGAHDVVNDGIGIAFDGDYTSNKITQAQFDAAVALCTRLCQRHSINDTVTPVATPTASFGTRNLPRICGHGDRFGSACPGTPGGTTVRLDELRKTVNNKL